MTDTQGITQHATSSPSGAKQARLVLKPQTGKQGLAKLNLTKSTTGSMPRVSGDKRPTFDRAALVRAAFHELRMLQNQGAQFVFETRFEGDFSVVPRRVSRDPQARLPFQSHQGNRHEPKGHGQGLDWKKREAGTAKQGVGSLECKEPAAADATKPCDGSGGHFSLLKLADFLILGPGGKTLLLKLNYKRRAQAMRSPWHARLMTLGHAIAYIECETPLDGRERVRQLMEAQGYAPVPFSSKSDAHAKAHALFA